MTKYKINLTQDVMAQVQVKFEIESDRPENEIREEFEEYANQITRLGRIWNIEDELEYPEEYIEGTFENELVYEGDDGGVVDFYLNDELYTGDDDEVEDDEGFL